MSMKPIKDKNKPKGKCSSYGFYIKLTREQFVRDHPDIKVIFSEFQTMSSRRWAAMSEHEKRPFKELAEQDKIRHEEQMRHYIPPPGTAPPKKSKKAKKDPNAPKKPLASFFWFAAEYRPMVKQNCPALKGTEQSKILGKMWRTFSDDQKERYAEMAAKDKERYTREQAEYDAVNGVAAPAKGMQLYRYLDDEEEEEQQQQSHHPMEAEEYDDDFVY